MAPPPAAPACESFVSGCESGAPPPDLEPLPEYICVIKCPEDQGPLRGLHLVLEGEEGVQHSPTSRRR